MFLHRAGRYSIWMSCFPSKSDTFVALGLANLWERGKVGIKRPKCLFFLIPHFYISIIRHYHTKLLMFVGSYWPCIHRRGRSLSMLDHITAWLLCQPYVFAFFSRANQPSSAVVLAIKINLNDEWWIVIQNHWSSWTIANCHQPTSRPSSTS